ncbi:MAG: M14 family zinc carboxypeptidase [Bacteroides sp.]|jgi:hypothetical protein|nr:M14 family zinc carboxypeptidase [Bacteroides sp.]
MKQYLILCLLSLYLSFLLPNQSVAQGAENLTTPESFFGFKPGADQKLIAYEPMMDYLKLLAQQSDRIQIMETGQTELGKPMYLVFISSAENLQNLDQLKAINRRLALDPDIPEGERQALIREGKTFLMTTMSMHANETGPAQAVSLTVYNLLSGAEPNMTDYLNDMVLMIVPSHNPDGQDMIVEHYNKYLGTPYEGSTHPGVYHKYVGHNINRDFITLSMKENQAISDIYSQEWFPHVLIEKHQMGMTGVRYFVPPNHDPIAENIDETLWNWSWVFGSNMSRDMTAKGLSGISQQYIFDNYWPGSTETSLWKNTISLLSEAASVQLATPVYVEPNELQVGGKGLSDYKKSINMPIPWPGGWWRLGDIVQYEVESTYSLIRTCARQREEILTSRNDLVRKEVERGQTEAPYFYILPAQQHDQGELIGLLQLLGRHGVSLYRLNQDATVEGRAFKAGDFVIPLAQPIRPFIKEVMESQEYPVRRYTPGGDIIQPYDITSWSLPLHRGITSWEITEKQEGMEEMLSQVLPAGILPERDELAGEYLVLSVNNNESFSVAFMAMSKGIEVFRNPEALAAEGRQLPAGSFLIRLNNRTQDELQDALGSMVTEPILLQNQPEGFSKLSLPRIALVETWLHDMDAGWARFLFDTYGIPYTVVRPSEMKELPLMERFDVIIFADSGKDQLMQGTSQRGEQYYIPFYPREYVKGMGKEGWQNVLGFIQEGGKVLSWGRSVDLFSGLMEPKEPLESFRFPVNNTAQSLERQGLKIPGSLLQIKLLPGHPLTLGMPETIGVFHRSNVILQTTIPTFDMDRRVIGSFPESDILMSGYAEKAELLEKAPALVWLKKGKGQVVLYSFVPNFRGSTPVANKLIFNALLLE